MSRHDTLIIKETHRGLLYEDGIFREVLPAGRYQIPRPSSGFATFFRAAAPRVEVTLVDVRGRDRTVVVQDLLTADGATITASFVVQFRVDDPRAAIHQVKSFEERLYTEAQTAARRVLRGLSVEEVMASRDEIGEEILRQLLELAGDYGVAVTGLDFKDLILPEALRKVMNRAVLAKRLRQLQTVEAQSDEDETFAATIDEADLHFDAETEAEADVEDDSKLFFARSGSTRDRNPEARSEGLSIVPAAETVRGNGAHANGFDVALRRCRI